MLNKRLALVLLVTLASFICSITNGGSLFVQAKVASHGKNTVEPAQVNFETAMRKYKDHDVEGAIDAFLQAIYFSRNYYNPEAYYWLGVCYMDSKQDGKAIDALNKHCQQAVGATPEAHVLLAHLYLRNNRLDEAEKEANIALDQYHGPGPKARNVLGLIQSKQGNLSGAQYQFFEALGDLPWRYTEAWMNYAENFMKQEQWGSALDQFYHMINNKIVLKGLDYEKIFLDIGLCYLAKGDHQRAIDNWHECLNYNPNNATAHLQLAMLFDVEQHFASAIKEYEEVVRLSGDAAEVTRVKERIHALEQKVAPAEVEPLSPKPSVYMRQKMKENEREEKKQKDSLVPTPSSKESGF